jgi:hypothetical protein
MYYSKLRNRTIQTYHKISTFPYSLSSLFVGKSKIDTLTSKNPQLQSPHRLVSSYCPESFDGFVKNKLPGKLFLISIMKQFLCIVRTYFVPRGVTIYH